MAELKRKLMRLELAAEELSPEQSKCPCCLGRPQIAFSDEPDNFGHGLPYDGAGGTCRLCHRPPTSTKIIPLSELHAKAYAAIPWSEDPRLRYIEKMSMMIGVWREHGSQEVRDFLGTSPHFSRIESIDRQLIRLQDRDANGMSKLRLPERAKELA